MDTRSVEVDEAVWAELKRNAEPFEDTPNSVLRRLLGIDHNGSGSNGSANTTPSGRARTDSLLPEAEYEMPILKVLAERGGRAATQEVVEAVYPHVKDKLSALDREQLKSGGIRWQTRVQFTRLRLVERGLMKKNSPRGTWEISAEGQKLVDKAS